MDAIYENWMSGGSIAGCSAGAMAVAGRIFGEPRRPGPITPIPLPQETRSS